MRKRRAVAALFESPRDLAVVDGASENNALSPQTVRASLIQPRRKLGVGARTVKEDGGKVTESEERNAEFMLRARDLRGVRPGLSALVDYRASTG